MTQFLVFMIKGKVFNLSSCTISSQVGEVIEINK